MRKGILGLVVFTDPSARNASCYRESLALEDEGVLGVFLMAEEACRREAFPLLAALDLIFIRAD